MHGVSGHEADLVLFVVEELLHVHQKCVNVGLSWTHPQLSCYLTCFKILPELYCCRNYNGGVGSVGGQKLSDVVEHLRVHLDDRDVDNVEFPVM